jgi:hypothetical protein
MGRTGASLQERAERLGGKIAAGGAGANSILKLAETAS